MSPLKAEVIKLVESLPDDCTLEVIQTYLRNFQLPTIARERPFIVARTKEGRLEQMNLCELLLLILARNRNSLPMRDAISKVDAYLSATSQVEDVDTECNNKNDWDNWECDLRYAKGKGVNEGWLEKANSRKQPWRLTESGMKKASEIQATIQ